MRWVKTQQGSHSGSGRGATVAAAAMMVRRLCCAWTVAGCVVQSLVPCLLPDSCKRLEQLLTWKQQLHHTPVWVATVVSVWLQFYAMVDFCNPGCLGTPAEFRKHFESPILAGKTVDLLPSSPCPVS